jgi:hypothetical protein
LFCGPARPSGAVPLGDHHRAMTGVRVDLDTDALRIAADSLLDQTVLSAGVNAAGYEWTS